MKYAIENGKEILELYRGGMSTYQVAEEMGTYPTKIRRALIYMGEELRDYSKAQSNAISTGRHQHPTKGKSFSDSHKVNMSRSLCDYWETMPEEEKERRCQQSKDRWDAMTDAEKAALQEAANKGIRTASKEGSKTERFLFEELNTRGYAPRFHVTDMLKNENLEVDILIPGLKVAIEVDGPSHFLPIWGDEKLKKQIDSDTQKQGLLLKEGFIIIRIKNLLDKPSLAAQTDLITNVVNALEKIKKSRPKRKKFIEIEV